MSRRDAEGAGPGGRHRLSRRERRAAARGPDTSDVVPAPLPVAPPEPEPGPGSEAAAPPVVPPVAVPRPAADLGDTAVRPAVAPMGDTAERPAVRATPTDPVRRSVQDPVQDPVQDGPDRATRSLLASSAVMAAGTVFSRASGLIRSLLLAALLGGQLLADQFAIGNTIPTMIYILVAGGVFNAVLVPQLVRAMRDHEDGGEAYTNRIVTLAVLFLGVVTVLLVLGAPWVMEIYLNPSWDDPELAAQRASVITMAQYCLPQVFFYGMFALVGQILNARGRFGPMMWAPIANNVIAIAVLLIYLVLHGTADGEQVNGALSSSQQLLLGLGATVGIVVQLLILLPFLRAAGFRYRPRFDFRGGGLGHTLRLGVWTVAFVIVNQVAATVVVRLASGGTAAGATGAGEGTGYFVYSTVFLVAMVPHSVITVSLATAALPRLSAHAAEGDLTGVADTLASVLRRTLALMVPIALLLPVLAPDAARAATFGAVSDSAELFIPSLALFGPGILLFTVHYLVLRGFYAVERTRTVFVIQCFVAATNVAVAVVLVGRASPEQTVPALVLAYTASYAVGSVISYTVLRRTLGTLRTGALLRFGARLAVAVAVCTGATLAVALGLRALTPDPGQLQAATQAAVLTVLDLGLLLLLGRLLRITELSDVTSLLTRRLASRRGR